MFLTAGRCPSSHRTTVDGLGGRSLAGRHRDASSGARPWLNMVEIYFPNLQREAIITDGSRASNALTTGSCVWDYCSNNAIPSFGATSGQSSDAASQRLVPRRARLPREIPNVHGQSHCSVGGLWPSGLAVTIREPQSLQACNPRHRRPDAEWRSSR